MRTADDDAERHRITMRSNDGSSSSRPSTALSTEIAGVISASQ
jgi:hypothetical protein